MPYHYEYQPDPVAGLCGMLKCKKTRPDYEPLVKSHLVPGLIPLQLFLSYPGLGGRYQDGLAKKVMGREGKLVLLPISSASWDEKGPKMGRKGRCECWWSKHLRPLLFAVIFTSVCEVKAKYFDIVNAGGQESGGDNL